MAQPVKARLLKRSLELPAPNCTSQTYKTYKCRAAKPTSAELYPAHTSSQDVALLDNSSDKRHAHTEQLFVPLEPSEPVRGTSIMRRHVSTCRPCRPVWHPPWKMYRVMSGHSGCVRSIAFDSGNNWFCTGSDDRTIKIWDVASGQLKLTLTGHVLPVRGLALSSKHTYLFSAGLDKEVKCWDLEYNRVIHSYHGHLSGVYCLTLHPTLDIVLTGGRDSTCRVWDMRTKTQVYALSGHEATVSSVMAQAMDPQVITGSHDTTIKLWDLAAGKYMSTLTFHKKSIGALAKHPSESSFASASTGCIKKFRLPKGEFLTAISAKQGNSLHCAAVNEESVMVSGGDDGSLWFWDWSSGHNFQQLQTKGQPGSLECEQAIYALSYDVTGTRLVTCEADKTVKMWKQDENATPYTHPLNIC